MWILPGKPAAVRKPCFHTSPKAYKRPRGYFKVQGPSSPLPQQPDGSGWRCFHCPQHCLFCWPGSACWSVTLPARAGIEGAKGVLTGPTDMGQGEELLPLLAPRCCHTRPGGRLHGRRDILPIQARVLLATMGVFAICLCITNNLAAVSRTSALAWLHVFVHLRWFLSPRQPVHL